MKQTIIFVLICAAVFSACSDTSGRPLAGADTVPAMEQAADGEEATRQERLEERIAEEFTPDDEEIVPKISVNPPLNLVQAMDVNLDLDRYEEQLLVVKNGDSPDSEIRIVIADYDTLRDGYIAAWEAPTASTQRRFFSVSLADIIGDHNTEIVCSGIDSEGRQTVDVFRRSSGGNGIGLSYESILSLAVPGTIELRESERSQAYLNGLKNGESFPVVTTIEEGNEIITSMFAWRSGENSYIKVNEERTPRGEIEDRKLKELFNGGVEDFERFLSRSWTGGEASTLFFDKPGGEITLYSGDIQEIYRWTSSYRFLSNSISLKGENELIPYMSVEIAVRIVDNSTIQVTLYDIDSQTGRRNLNDSWSGTYHSGTGIPETNRGDADAGRIELPRLSGFYRGESGEELFLDPPRFTFSDADTTISGGFAVYMLNLPVFALKIIDEKGIVTEERSYRLIYRENSDPDKITRSLILVPGVIGVRGFVESDEGELRFRQIEYFEQEQEEEGAVQ